MSISVSSARRSVGKKASKVIKAAEDWESRTNDRIEQAVVTTPVLENVKDAFKALESSGGSGKSSSVTRMELSRPASGNYGSLEYSSLAGGRYGSSSTTRNVYVTSSVSTDMKTSRLSDSFESLRSPDSVKSVDSSLRSSLNFSHGGGGRDSVFSSKNVGGTTVLTANLGRADSVSSLSSLESYTLPKAASRKATLKTTERMDMIDDVDDVDLQDVAVTTVAETKLVSVAAKRLYEVSSTSRHQNYQDYEHIRQTCVSRGRLFKDPLFRANDKSLAWEDAQRHTESIGPVTKKDKVYWLRPHQILKRRDELGQSLRSPSSGSANQFDFIQGDINDSWLLAALASLAFNKKALKKVVPKDQRFDSGYVGLFRFNFWRFGEWHEVVIDDRLPTRHNSLVYLRSRDENEFWCSLIEKAYAKWYGSYQALTCGLASEAAVDLTGGIPEKIDLSTTFMTPQRLFHILRSAYERGSFMACSILQSSQLAVEAQEKGLQTINTFAITKVVEIRAKHVDQGIPLIKLRNPKGNNKEWRGDWCDGDAKWNDIPEEIRRRLDLVFADDGEFYMGFRDFMKYFGLIEICHLPPEKNHRGSSSSEVGLGDRSLLQTFTGSWKLGISAGGSGKDGQIERFSTNPQHFVDLRDSNPLDGQDVCPVVIALAQRQDYGRPFNYIGFKVYRVPRDVNRVDAFFLRRNAPVARSGSFINFREVSARVLLPPGRYCIVPSTFDPDRAGDYMLRVLEEKDWGVLRQPVIENHAVQVKNRDGTTSLDRQTSVETITVTFTRNVDGDAGKLNEMYRWTEDAHSEHNLLNRMFKEFNRN